MEAVTVIPAIRKDRQTAGKVNVVIRVLVKRTVVKTLTAGIKITPEHWDEATRRIGRAEPNHALYNAKIDKEVSRLNAEFVRKELLDVSLTKDRVKKIAEGKDPGRCFYDFCLGRDRKGGWLTEKYTNKETLRTYISEVTKLQLFAPALAFGDIHYKFLTAYKRYMQEVRKNEPNTIFKSFKFLNTMMIDAVKIGGLIDRNPFKDFDRGKYEEPHKLGISLEECDSIRILIDKIDGVVKWVAIKFLLMCYSGLRYEDAMRYDPLIHSIDGDRIEMKTSKKGVHVNLKLYSRLSDIITLLRQVPGQRMPNYEMNDFLKIIADKATVTSVPLTCHVGRHTFGELLAEMNVPIEVAQKLLGHKDIRSTRVYYRIKDKTMDQSMDRLNAL